MATNNIDIHVWANDADNALEIAGNGVEEFDSKQEAIKAFDVEYHGEKKLYRILVSLEEIGR